MAGILIVLYTGIGVIMGIIGNIVLHLFTPETPLS